ncbi:DUF4870 domain-containing protein [Pseudoflavitalea rhizosphaerae]|uniref:DUF4870 domain-containing protein n=1 Tax=Pseudoflavitalea rhizosphaerae TaxID=1884793 RepID=UPI0013E068B0|nr:DUF4870 domain-containing protein [Pseudoflavitalea rhizosphaerae]
MNAQDTNSIFGTADMPPVPPASEEKTMAILSHILAIVPGIGILAPLVIYLVKRNEGSFVEFHARESLNFQITILLAYIISAILIIVLVGLLFLWVLPVVNIVLVIVATIRASEGRYYRYPFCIRMV